MTDDFYRIRRLPPYVFAEVNAMKAAARARGEDIVDLGMGNPDGAPPKHVIEKLAEVAAKPTAHRYSASKGIPGLRRAQAKPYPDAQLELAHLAGGTAGHHHLLAPLVQKVEHDVGVGRGLLPAEHAQRAGRAEVAPQLVAQAGAFGGRQVQALEGELRRLAQMEAAAGQRSGQRGEAD